MAPLLIFLAVVLLSVFVRHRGHSSHKLSLRCKVYWPFCKGSLLWQALNFCPPLQHCFWLLSCKEEYNSEEKCLQQDVPAEGWSRWDQADPVERAAGSEHDLGNGGKSSAAPEPAEVVVLPMGEDKFGFVFKPGPHIGRHALQGWFGRTSDTFSLTSLPETPVQLPPLPGGAWIPWVGALVFPEIFLSREVLLCLLCVYTQLYPATKPLFKSLKRLEFLAHA